MRIAIIFFILVTGFSCTQKEKLNLVVTRDEQGKITSEVHYINDTIKHGLAKYYYTNGDISREIEYVNGVREGWFKHYKPGGILENKIHYRNGLQDGPTYWYYNNGAIESKGNWLEDKPYGSSNFFYPSGKIKYYQCRDFAGNVLYLVKWDEHGYKIKEEGVVFSPEFYVSNHDSANTLLANQEVVIQITVAEPPETKATIWMGEINENLKELLIENNTAKYKCIYPQAGNYRLVTIGEIKDKEGVILKRDSITTDFIVR
jgi:hypothetical protein